MKRINAIDMCRGLLFILMTSTHALTLANVSNLHWLRSDWWLPNGWGTVVFVVLSGYGVGHLIAHREPIQARDQKLRSRALEIFWVMVCSNALFLVLRHLMVGEFETVKQASWWLGIVTLDTPWTISGVLLPTAALLVLAPWLIRFIQVLPWASLGIFVLAQAACWWTANKWQQESESLSWMARLTLTEGLGGFALLPFVLNGCMGLWLGMMHRQYPSAWLKILPSLAAVQALTYVALLQTGGSDAINFLTYVTGACAKFGCVFLVAIFFTKMLPRSLANSIETLGKYALGSFVLHRVFLQAVAAIMSVALIKAWSPEVSYAVLLISALVLTWGTCIARQRFKPLETALSRIYL